MGIAPTEMVHLEIRKMYEDFNYQMQGNRWFHFEFESDRITLDDLKRFREYEAVTSRTYGVAVTTFVVCPAEVRKPISQFTEGLNTYRVKIIRLKSQTADRIFRQLSAQGESPETIANNLHICTLYTFVCQHHRPRPYLRDSASISLRSFPENCPSFKRHFQFFPRVEGWFIRARLSRPR